jgi:acryloyl-coenzyme A reductase
VLVTGASGGVGSAAIALAKAQGCRVTAVTTSESKKNYILDTLRADDVVIANPDGKFAAAPHDMVIECVGGPTFSSSLRATAPGGKLVLVGNVTNAKVDLPLGYCILNSISIVGSDSIRREELSGPLVNFMEKHNLVPHVHSVLPLGDAGKAHEILEQRAVSGRIVLEVSGNNWTTVPRGRELD